MEDNATHFSALIERIESYSKTTIDLIKLKTVDKIAVIASNIALGVIIFILTFFFLMILNLALAFWLGDLLGSIHQGFFVVAGFYVLLIIVFLVFKKQIVKTPLTNTIISKILK